MALGNDPSDLCSVVVPDTVPADNNQLNKTGDGIFPAEIHQAVPNPVTSDSVVQTQKMQEPINHNPWQCPYCDTKHRPRDNFKHHLDICRVKMF